MKKIYLLTLLISCFLFINANGIESKVFKSRLSKKNSFETEIRQEAKTRSVLLDIPDVIVPHAELDSVVLYQQYGNSKRTYKYDAVTRTLQEEYFYKNNSDGTTIYVFNVSGKLLSRTSQYFDENAGVLKYSSKEVYEYNSTNQEVLEAYYRWSDDFNDWVGEEKSETSYNASGIISSWIYYGWDKSSNTWRKTGYSVVTEYDNNGYPTKYEEYDEGEHIVDGYAVYDSKGNILSSKNIEYDDDGKPLEINIVEYTYDENNKLLSEIYQYSSDGGITFKGEKTLYEYNNNQLSLKTDYNWNNETNDWVYSGKETRTYDDKTRLSVVERYYADSPDSDYLEKYFYKSDLGINISTEEAPKVYVKNGVLCVENNVAEIITIYSVNGQQLKSISKTELPLEYNIGDLFYNVLIVKGNTGWTSKVFNK